MDILDDVHAELGREKWPENLSQVVTRWSSRFRETHGSSANQYDFELAIKKMMVGKSGRDDDEEEEDGEEGPMDEPADGDWGAWAQ